MTLSHVDMSQYPELERIAELVSMENPLQRKRIEAFLAQQDTAYFRFAESLSRRLPARFFRQTKAGWPARGRITVHARI